MIRELDGTPGTIRTSDPQIVVWYTTPIDFIHLPLEARRP